MKRLVRTLIGPTLIVLTGPALTQLPTVVLSVGDALPSGDVVDGIQEFNVDSSGRWVASVDVDPGPGSSRSLISSEGGELYEDGPLPGVAGTVGGTNRIDRDGLGNVYCVLTADLTAGGTSRMIHQNFTAPLVTDADFLVGPDFGPAARLATINQIEVNDGGDLLAIGTVTDPARSPSTFDAIVEFEIQNGAITSTSLAGSIAIVVDLTDIPVSPPVAVQAGETWNFQAWFRDMNPGQTSNFALPVSVTFQ